jgi:rhs family protein
MDAPDSTNVSTERVKFDDATSDAFANACRGVAQNIDNTLPGLKSSLTKALEDFEGHYAEITATNIDTAVSDGRDIANILRQLATVVDRLKEAAHKENENRDRMYHYETDLGGFRKWWNETFGGDPPKAEHYVPDTNIDTASLGHRESTETRSSGMPVSSARPSTVRALSGTLANLGTSFDAEPGKLRSLASEFAAKCQWGTIDAENLISTFEAWNKSNANDKTWLGIVANTFEKYGSSGQIVAVADSVLDGAITAAGVSTERHDLEVPTPAIVGKSTTSGYVNDPVNVATGNFIEEETDMAFSGVVSACSVTRMYNSVAVFGQHAVSGVFGAGWSSNIESRVQLNVENAVWTMADGREVTFDRMIREDGTHGYARAPREAWWLEELPLTQLMGEEGSIADPSLRYILHATGYGASSLLRISDNSGTQHIFSLTGVYLGMSAGAGTAVAYLRDEEGRVSSIVHQRGARINVEYTEGGLVGAIHSSRGQSVRYEYVTLDGRTHLCAVHGDAGTRRYEHDAAGLIHRVVASTGTVEVTNYYDPAGRITEQDTEYGRRVRYRYLPNGITDVSNEDASYTNLWVNDQYARLTAIVDAEGGRTSYAYDDFGNRVSVVDRDGSRTTRYSDERGRIIREVTDEGAETLFAYDEHDRVVSVAMSAIETDPRARRAARLARRARLEAEAQGRTLDEATSGQESAQSPAVSPMTTVTYEYANDFERNPSSMTDGNGHVTRFEWADGLLQRVVSPEGVTVSLEYDECGLLTGIRNAEQQLTRCEYSAAGHLVKIVSALGLETEFTYDSAGHMVCRQDPDGSRWRFEYAAGGRLVASVDPAGARTEYEYGPSGDIVAVVDPLGRRMERSFDTNGNIDRITLPGGAQFSYAYDGLMRLVRTIDPAGGVWTREYDAASTLTALIDPTGVSVRTSVDSSRKTFTTNDGVDRVRISCDHLGRPVRTEVLPEDSSPQVSADADDPTVSTMVYDGAGNPVQVLDAEGGLSRYEYNGSNQMVRMISPAGRVTEYSYDACGRLATTYEAAGTAEQSVTRYEYDADSRLIRQVYGDGSEARVRYDACGRVLSITGSGVASPVFYTWDSCGRVKSIRDNKWGTRSFTYDAASQVVAVTNGAGGVTHYRYDEAGNVTSVMDPAGRITSYEYDLMGNVLAATNPLGARTTSTYDAAGRLLTSTDGNGAVHSFGYDRDGVPCSHSVNGSLLYRMERDSARRTMTTYDHAGVDAFGAPVVTVESYDRLGRLVRQRREFGAQIPQSFRTEYMDETGGYELSYAYDADGLRTEFVHPLGSSAYAYDAAGRMVKQTDITAYRLDGTAVTSESRVESSFEYNAVDALVRAQVSDLAGTWVREFGYRGAHMSSVTEQPAEADSSEALHTEIIRDDLGRISGVDSPAGLVMYTYTDAQMLSSAVRGTETLRWAYDAAGALVRVEYFDSAQPQNAWVKVLVTDEGARVRAVCVYGVQDEAKADSRSAEFASAVEDAQAWLPQCPESVEVEGVTLVPVSTSVFSYDGNDSRLLQVSSDGSGSSLNYGAAGFVSSVASWGSAEDSAVSFSLLCASTDGRVLAAGGAPTGVPEFGVPSTGANAGSAAGFDASVMHPLVWDENSFVPRVLGVGGSSMPSVGSLVPGAGSGAGLLDPYGWASLGVAAPAVPSAQGASATGGAPVLPDSLVGVSAASGLVLGASGFEVLGARVVDSRVARFTAPDPLAAPVGAGWGADPFSLVGGNPVSLVDPWGLSPVSIEEFEKQARPSGIAGWVRNNWEYVAGGAMVIAGVVVGAIGTGLGPLGGAAFGAASGALMGAGMSVIEDKAKGKPVDWSKAGREAVKGGITGAVTGALTGGLGNLKKIADAASKMTKIEKAAEAAKATRLAQKAAEAGALASKWHKVKTAVATQGRNIGASMKESKIAEDMIKDTLSGGLNNVMGYYMDDTVKDKSVMGGIGMFISGAGASAIGSRYSGGLKTGMGVSGYSGDIARVGIRGRATDVFTGAVADTGGGFIKTSVQYTTDKAVLGRQLDWDEYIDKVATGAIKDFSKSSVKGAVKMDAGVAGKYRDRVAYPMYQVAEAVQNPVGAVNQMINNMFSTSVIMKAIK